MEWQTCAAQNRMLQGIRVQVPYSPPIGMKHKNNIPMQMAQGWAASPTHYGHQFSRLERHPDKMEVPGSIPGCPTSDMGSEPIAHRPIPQIKLFDEIVPFRVPSIVPVQTHTAILLQEECEFESHRTPLGFWRNGLRD